MSEMKEKQWLTVDDVAELLQIKRPCARRKMKEMADYSIHVDIDNMQISEDLHMILDHMMMWVFSHSEQENNR